MLQSKYLHRQSYNRFYIITNNYGSYFLCLFFIACWASSIVTSDAQSLVGATDGEEEWKFIILLSGSSSIKLCIHNTRAAVAALSQFSPSRQVELSLDKMDAYSGSAW